MKKNKQMYVKPAMQVYKIEPSTMLAGSPGEDQRGSRYDEIRFEDEYCTNPR